MLRAKGPEGVRALRVLIDTFRINVESFTEADAETAITADTRYGKGMGHPAQLNILDTCSYALAARLNEPLLFKGNDFSCTDIMLATGTATTGTPPTHMLS